MNRQEIEQLLPELNIFLDTLRRFSLLLILITFAGYGSAFWLWSVGQTPFALFAASLSFIIFYFTKQQLVSLTRYYLKQDPHYHQTIHFIQKNLARKTESDFIKQLQQALQVIQKNSA
jgi:small-conductance mechanosensitive channel